jgi:hypothetical protein
VAVGASAAGSARARLDSAEDFDQSVVDVEAITATHQGLPFFFDPDVGLLMVADDKGVDLKDRLVHQTDGFFDRLFVDLDDQTAQELVEVIFQTVFFGVSYLDRELHRLNPFGNIFD